MFDFITGRSFERHEQQRQVNDALSSEMRRTRHLVDDLGRQNDALKTTDAQIMDYLRRTAEVASRGRKGR